MLLETLQFREFRLLWMGQLGVSMGTWMDQVTRGWLMYDLTGSPLQLGLVSAIRFLPMLLLSPLAGTAADRYGRKTQLVANGLGTGALNFLLGVLVLTGQIRPWHLYVTAVLVAVLHVFQQPARQAMAPEAVDRQHLTNAIGLNSMAFNSSRTIGPALAGGLVAVFGAGGCYLVQGVIYVLSSIWTLQLRLPNKPPMSAAARGGPSLSFLDSILEGWRYVWRTPIIRSAVAVSYLTALMGLPFATLLPVFARDVLQVGAQGQGILLTASGVGALTSAFVLASIGDRLPKGLLIFGGFLVYGLGLVVFSQSHWFVLSLVVMVIIGLCAVTSGALVQTVVQAHSPPELRGRILGVYLQSQVMITIGGLMAGSGASLWGAQTTVELMGAAMVAVAIAVFFAMPMLRTVR
jgi:MFS family permease